MQSGESSNDTGAAGLPRTRTPSVSWEIVSLGSVDVRAVHARVELVDDDPTMFVDDGDREIEFSSGLGGSWDQAIEGAERIASVALEFAAALRLHRPLPRSAYVRPPSSWPNNEA